MWFCARQTNIILSKHLRKNNDSHTPPTHYFPERKLAPSIVTRRIVIAQPLQLTVEFNQLQASRRRKEEAVVAAAVVAVSAAVVVAAAAVARALGRLTTLPASIMRRVFAALF
jgi:hypothetical protein